MSIPFPSERQPEDDRQVSTYDTSAHAFDPEATPDPFGLPEIDTKVLDPTDTQALAPGLEPAVQVEIKEKPDASE
jgi:hypothetical protein